MTGTSSFQNVTNRRTPSPEAHATAEDPPSTPDVDVNEVTLGAHGDKPLAVRPGGGGAGAGFYIITDGATGDRYEAPQGFQGWYGFYGAGHHMRVGSIARSFPWAPGEDMPIGRAHSMEKDLRRQSESLRPPTREEMQERYDPCWGHREATSLFKEVGDSAETGYYSDMYVCDLEDGQPMEGDSLRGGSTSGVGRPHTGRTHGGQRTSSVRPRTVMESHGPNGWERNPPAITTIGPRDGEKGTGARSHHT
jgi:hypothetical protein